MQYLSLRMKLRLLILGLLHLWWLRWKFYLRGLKRPRMDNRTPTEQEQLEVSFQKRRQQFSITFPHIAENISLWILGMNFAAVLVIFIVWQISVAFIYKVANTPYTGPTVATIMPTPTEDTRTTPLEMYEYYTPRESETLRSKRNVINIAVIGDGYGVRYMKDQTVVFDPLWAEVPQIFGITGFTPGSTSFTIKVDVRDYTLNHYQGFILAHMPGKIYMISGDNRMWQTEFAEEKLVPLEKGIQHLTSPIPPNNNLSLTFK